MVAGVAARNRGGLMIATVFLVVLAVLAMLGGISVYSPATTIMQQLAGLLFFLIAATLFTGGAITSEIASIRNSNQKMQSYMAEILQAILKKL